jgi:hypothetical protein
VSRGELCWVDIGIVDCCVCVFLSVVLCTSLCVLGAGQGRGGDRGEMLCVSCFVMPYLLCALRRCEWSG